MQMLRPYNYPPIEIMKNITETLEDEFGDIIKKARTGIGYSLEQLSTVTGIEPSVLADFEAYCRAPAESEVNALAEALMLDREKLNEIAKMAWQPLPEPWRIEPNARIRVVQVDVGGYSENCYIAGSRDTEHAFIVDPGGSAAAIVEAVRDEGFTPMAIVITHRHYDHTSGAAELAERLDIGEVIGPSEALNKLHLAKSSKRRVEDGKEIDVGNLRIQALSTPGHTSESTCYLFGRICFVGDTLFAGSLGRAMAGPAAYQTLLTSVRDKILTLPGETALLPGHGPATTVQEELLHNPFL
ncbi:MAG: MBL fold metallo-hydrolase [Armatimonadota bacterium]|nr:MBL fold metallo-hydrolase [Armatimonadota bacterium]